MNSDWITEFLYLNSYTCEFICEFRIYTIHIHEFIYWNFLWRLVQQVIKGLEGKINCQALLAALLLCLHWSDRSAQTVFPSWWQLLQAATGLLDKNKLPLLQYWLCSRVNNVLMLFNLLAATSYFFFHVKWKFQWNWLFFHVKWKFQWLLLTKVAPIAWLNLSISHWSLSKNITKEQILLFQMKSCAKQHVWDNMSKERASAQIWIEQHSYFRWLSAKAWKQCQEWFWIDYNQNLQPDWS